MPWHLLLAPWALHHPSVSYVGPCHRLLWLLLVSPCATIVYFRRFGTVILSSLLVLSSPRSLANPSFPVRDLHDTLSCSFRILGWPPCHMSLRLLARRPGFGPTTPSSPFGGLGFGPRPVLILFFGCANQCIIPESSPFGGLGSPVANSMISFWIHHPSSAFRILARAALR